VIHLEIGAAALIPCAICNKSVRTGVKVPEFYHTEMMSEVRGRVYNYTSPLREAILLEVPAFGECQGGCPERKELEKYKPPEGNSDPTQFPFADLE